MADQNAQPRMKYPAALHAYREVLKYDSANQKAKDDRAGDSRGCSFLIVPVFFLQSIKKADGYQKLASRGQSGRPHVACRKDLRAGGPPG